MNTTIENMHWLAKQLQAEATEQGIKQQSVGAEYCREAAAELSAANARIAELEAQLQKAKAMPMKYRRMEFNAQLQQENEALQARVNELESQVEAESLRCTKQSIEDANEFNLHHEDMLMEIDGRDKVIDQLRVKHGVACDTISRMQADREVPIKEIRALQARVKELESEYKECRDDTGRLSAECFELTAHCERLKEALEKLTQFNSSEEYIEVRTEHVTYGRKALSATPSQSLAKHDAELLRKAATHLESYEYLKQQPAINYAEAHELRRIADELEKKS